MTRKTSFKIRRTSKKQLAGLLVSACIALILLMVQSCKTQQTAPAKTDKNMPKAFQNVEVISVYDGDTFKINIPCDMDVFCENVSVRVRGVDTPEIKGKTEREKQLAKKAKKFTQDFLKQTPVSLTDCGRDKYFRLLCNVQNKTGKDLAQELIKADLGYAYQGGTKSDQYQ